MQGLKMFEVSFRVTGPPHMTYRCICIHVKLKVYQEAREAPTFSSPFPSLDCKASTPIYALQPSLILFIQRKKLGLKSLTDNWCGINNDLFGERMYLDHPVL